MMNNNLPEKKFYFIRDLERLIGCSRMTLRRWWMAGKFPKPFKLNGGKLAWSAPVVDAWVFAIGSCCN